MAERLVEGAKAGAFVIRSLSLLSIEIYLGEARGHKAIALGRMALCIARGKQAWLFGRPYESAMTISSDSPCPPCLERVPERAVSVFFVFS